MYALPFINKLLIKYIPIDLNGFITDFFHKQI